MRRTRRGQTLVETTIALLIATSVFLCLFKLSHMLTGKILLEHAAMRVARARAVGFKDWMCWKVGTVAAIPVLGKRLWPEGDELDAAMELARVPIFLGTPDSEVARGVLEYEHRLKWTRGGTGPCDNVTLGLKTDWFDLDGRAGIEDNWSLYLNDGGL